MPAFLPLTCPKHVSMYYEHIGKICPRVISMSTETVNNRVPKTSSCLLPFASPEQVHRFWFCDYNLLTQKSGCHHAPVWIPMEPVAVLSPCLSLNFHRTCHCVVTMPQSEFPYNLSLCCHHAPVLMSIEPVTVLSPCPSLNFHRTCRCVNCHPMPSSEFPYNLSLCCHHTRVLMSIEPVTALSPCPSLNFHTTCRCVNCHPMPSSLYNNLYC